MPFDIELFLNGLSERHQDNHAVNHAILHRLVKQNDKLMSAISDFSAKVEANFARVNAGIQALDKKIQDFQNSPGTLSPADQAALDQISADSDKLATAAEVVVPVPVPAA